MIQKRPRRAPAEPSIRLFTRDEYHRMGEMGFFLDQRVELIGGEVFAMSPQSMLHVRAVWQVVETLRNTLPKTCSILQDAPIVLIDESEPEPDVAVVLGSVRGMEDLPTTAALVVEVSLSSLDHDRRRKMSLYAASGIRDYWLVNLHTRQLEVRREPVSDASQRFGWTYSDVQVLNAEATVRPLEFATVELRVADLLP